MKYRYWFWYIYFWSVKGCWYWSIFSYWCSKSTNINGLTL